MNRLVLIGNGFDIAHGLKTRYENFIDWYWEEIGIHLIKANTNVVSDILCSFTLKTSNYYSTWFQFWSGQYLHKSDPYSPWKGNEVVDLLKKHSDLCNFSYRSSFFEKINKSIESKGWVDIEHTYYSYLLARHSITKDDESPYRKLNMQLEFLREKLIEYLNQESKKEIATIESVKEKIYRPIERQEIAIGLSKAFSLDDLTPKNIMLLNFNYTNTSEMYLADNSTINYIHGKLDDPKSVIFGYGDEIDENYKRLKEQNDSECMRHVKSIRYLEHDNYRRMLEFIESEPFQVCIMGHSCGNSDRTLLNTIFEHRNCISIKPYYYQKDDRTDTYSELTININRNFNNPKLMRDRVVCKDYCEPLQKTETDESQYAI